MKEIYYEVGEIFTLHDTKVKCVLDNHPKKISCKYCIMNSMAYTDMCGTYACSKRERRDKNEVIFEEVGV